MVGTDAVRPCQRSGGQTMLKQPPNVDRGWEVLRDSYLTILPRERREEYARLSPEEQQQILTSYVLEKARMLNPRLDEPPRRRSIWEAIPMGLAGRRRGR